MTSARPKGFNARKRLAFHPLQKRASGGRDEAEIVCYPRRVQSRHRVATARNSDQPCGLDPLSRMPRYRYRRSVEGWNFKNAQRTVPDHGVSKINGRVQTRR